MQHRPPSKGAFDDRPRLRSGRFQVPPPLSLPRALAYTAGVALPLGALLVDMAFRTQAEHVPYVLLFLAISFSAWVGGWGPGLVAVAASTAAGYWLMHSSHTPDHVAGALGSAALFLPVGMVNAVLSALARAGFQERERVAEELRQSELQLRKAVCLRDEFIAVASHELKTPLVSVQLRLEYLIRRSAESALAQDRELMRTISVLDRQLRRLGTLVNNVLDVSRISAGVLRLDLEEVDLAELVGEAVTHFSDQLDRQTTSLKVDTSCPVVGLWDRSRLEQIVVNLLSNASKYGKDQPIAIAVESTGSFAKLEVSDHGIGIAQEDQARVFERFERATQVGGGLGVGLWVVRELVSAHGGTIELRSALGQGTTISVHLPLRPPGTSRGGDAGGTQAREGASSSVAN